MRTPSRRGRRILLVAALLLGWAGCGIIVYQASYAAFSGTTSNAGNNWTAGTVSLSDDDSNGAMFSVPAAKGGDTGSKCIEVTYTGNLASTVKLYLADADLADNGLGQYITLQIDEGDGGTFADCTGFSGTNRWNGTLAAFNSTPHNTFATGIGTFAPSNNGDKKVYKFTYTVSNNAGAQGKDVTAKFTWEAQSS
jgi:hypothetical protein